MAILTKLLKLIDSISEKAGSLGKWFALLLVLVGAYDTIARHFFNAPTIWAYDTLCMSGGALYLIGASYTYLHESHSILFFFPLMGIMLKLSIVWAIKAWKIHEVMFQSFWYPPAGPYRTVFALGLFLLILQGVAKFIRDLYFIIRGESID